MVVLHTNFGDITIKMLTDKAPKTVANFLQYVEDGFYSNTLFHRVIDGFMVQGGGVEPGMVEKDNRDAIQNEANNGVSNVIGTLAMARTNDPHSATSQFFINVSNNHFLDFKSETPSGWGYCVFAEVVDGMDVVNKIKGVSVGQFGYHGDVPKEDVLIESAEIIA